MPARLIGGPVTGSTPTAATCVRGAVKQAGLGAESRQSYPAFCHGFCIVPALQVLVGIGDRAVLETEAMEHAQPVEPVAVLLVADLEPARPVTHKDASEPARDTAGYRQTVDHDFPVQCGKTLLISGRHGSAFLDQWRG